MATILKRLERRLYIGEHRLAYTVDRDWAVRRALISGDVSAQTIAKSRVDHAVRVDFPLARPSRSFRPPGAARRHHTLSPPGGGPLNESGAAPPRSQEEEP